MSEIEVEIIIDATPEVVWAGVEDIASHVDWMMDAAEIRFLTAETSGVGTTFECDTKVGPLKITDVMEITEWDEARVMGVRHSGYVTGVGKFTLDPYGQDKTRFRWHEALEFPWFLGGKVGSIVGKPVLTLIWKGNLKRLKASIERGIEGGIERGAHSS